MQVKSFLFTLGLGMAAGGAAMLMLPQNSKARKGAQKAVDTMEQGIEKMMK